MKIKDIKKIRFRNPFFIKYEEDLKRNLEKAVLVYREDTLDDKVVVHFIQDVLFQKKFYSFNKEPVKKLQSLYKMALSGDDSLLRDDFFREMRRQRDRNALKLSMILKNKEKL